MNASGRPNTCKSNGNSSFGKLTSGARVSNAYITYLSQRDSLGKLRIIPHSIIESHDLMIKVLAVRDGCAYH